MENSVSIFNLNCWLFPAPFSVDNDSRIENIVQMIRDHDPDVVTLQEVWSNACLKQITQSLPGYYAISSGGSFYNQGGLLTLTRSKPISSRTRFFNISPRHNPTEWALRKGYIIVELALGGSRLRVINTHLYAPFSSRAMKIPEKQLRDLLDDLPEGNAALCGDLNLDERTVLEINRGRLIRLCDREITYEAKNTYRRKRLNRLMSSQDKKIDYMFFRGAPLRRMEYNVIKTPLVSDHYPMFCRVALEQ